MIRRQLPAYSPLSLTALAGAAARSAGGAGGARGELAHLLEERFACRRAVLTGSGTQALELALRLGQEAGVPADGEKAPVALPAYSCFDVVSAAVGATVRVAFYDVNPRTLSPDLESLGAAVQRGTSVVVVANLYGYPLDWGGIRDVCQDTGATVVEDAAQGLGSEWQGRAGGTLGDATVLSFGRGKGWTGGGGGALLIRSEHLVRSWEGTEAQVLASPCGGLEAGVLSLAQWAFGRPWLFGIPSAMPGLGLGETRYKPPVPPRAISGFSAALALNTAAMARAEVENRKEVGARWMSALGGKGQEDGGNGLRPCVPVDGGEAGYLRFPVLLPASGPQAGDLAGESRRGVARGYHLPLNELPGARSLVSGEPSLYPGASELSRALVTLPTHRFTREGELEAILQELPSSMPRGH